MMDGTPVPLKILLVEDSIWMIGSITELIRQIELPSELRQVDSEDAAAHAVAEDEPDLVILDLKLKNGNGFSVLRTLTSKPRKPQVIVLTNYALPKYRTLAALMGADRFLDKASELHQLPSIIEAVWHSRTQVSRLIDQARDATRDQND